MAFALWEVGQLRVDPVGFSVEADWPHLVGVIPTLGRGIFFGNAFCGLGRLEQCQGLHEV